MITVLPHRPFQARAAGLAMENAAALAAAGVRVAICTDHPETPVQYLPLVCCPGRPGGGWTRRRL